MRLAYEEACFPLIIRHRLAAFGVQVDARRVVRRRPDGPRPPAPHPEIYAARLPVLLMPPRGGTYGPLTAHTTATSAPRGGTGPRRCPRGGLQLIFWYARLSPPPRRRRRRRPFLASLAAFERHAVLLVDDAWSSSTSRPTRRRCLGHARHRKGASAPTRSSTPSTTRDDDERHALPSSRAPRLAHRKQRRHCRSPVDDAGVSESPPMSRSRQSFTRPEPRKNRPTLSVLRLRRPTSSETVSLRDARAPPLTPLNLSGPVRAESRCKTRELTNPGGACRVNPTRYGIDMMGTALSGVKL